LFGLAEPALRASVFFGVLAPLMLAEAVWPRRKRMAITIVRWLTNAALVVIDTALVRLLAALAPAAAAATAATWAAQNGVGLFNHLHWPAPAIFIASLLALDFAIWLQHLVFHRAPVLWRLHRVHHADRDLDVTSALRFHPIEIVLSGLYKTALALALGLPAVAIIVFEILLNGCAMFNHANLALPRWVDGALRLVFVTPDMHRVHHSIHRREHDSNYGFCLSVWDRLFHTYRAEPEDGHQGMVIGLSQHQDDKPSRLGWSLAFPFLD
jgi:sterol desaturase/sphingolipid hydroxylase (fatty acid hydroxylase superfamily)